VSDGALVLVATPLGNLDDLSPRAVRELARADVVACEDTRRTGRLLQVAGVRAPRLVVVNDHTEAERVPELVEAVRGGARVALVTDAGMPAISDPGERLVRGVVAAGLAVEVVPGPSAAVTAVAVSGLPAARWVFEGFLPRKGPARARRLAEVGREPRTTVLYEAPHRLARTLDDLAAVAGADRAVVVVRELTKLHEEIWRGSLAGALERVAEVAPRGEHVIVLAGAPEAPDADDEALLQALRTELATGASRRDAVEAVAAAFGAPRRRVYELCLGLGRV
jgi:16S rRNA (cytidine1402-2'-O)-methyltransferase